MKSIPVTKSSALLHILSQCYRCWSDLGEVASSTYKSTTQKLNNSLEQMYRQVSLWTRYQRWLIKLFITQADMNFKEIKSHIKAIITPDYPTGDRKIPNNHFDLTGKFLLVEGLSIGPNSSPSSSPSAIESPSPHGIENLGVATAPGLLLKA